MKKKNKIDISKIRVCILKWIYNNGHILTRTSRMNNTDEYNIGHFDTLVTIPLYYINGMLYDDHDIHFVFFFSYSLSQIDWHRDRYTKACREKILIIEITVASSPSFVATGILDDQRKPFQLSRIFPSSGSFDHRKGGLSSSSACAYLLLSV